MRRARADRPVRSVRAEGEETPVSERGGVGECVCCVPVQSSDARVSLRTQHTDALACPCLPCTALSAGCSALSDRRGAPRERLGHAAASLSSRRSALCVLWRRSDRSSPRTPLSSVATSHCTDRRCTLRHALHCTALISVCSGSRFVGIGQQRKQTNKRKHHASTATRMIIIASIIRSEMVL